jgi:hypothetical protein
LSAPDVEERALAAVTPLPAGFDPARAEARVDGTNALFSVFAAFLPAGFRLIGFAAADPFVAGFAALAFFSGFFGFVGFVGFFAAVVVLAAVRPAREGAAVVRRDAALPCFAADTALVLRLSLAAFFFVTRFDFPAMVSLSLRLCRRARANSARLGSIFALVVFGQSHFFCGGPAFTPGSSPAAAAVLENAPRSSYRPVERTVEPVEAARSPLRIPAQPAQAQVGRVKPRARMERKPPPAQARPKLSRTPRRDEARRAAVRPDVPSPACGRPALWPERQRLAQAWMEAPLSAQQRRAPAAVRAPLSAQRRRAPASMLEPQQSWPQ